MPDVKKKVKQKPIYNLNEIGNHVKFTVMDDTARTKLVKTHIVIFGNYCYQFDGRKKKIVKREIA